MAWAGTSWVPARPPRRHPPPTNTDRLSGAAQAAPRAHALGATLPLEPSCCLTFTCPDPRHTSDLCPPCDPLLTVSPCR